jgi:hypothetical protein
MKEGIMSDQTSFEVRIYSPRWGHDDAYTIKLERDHMEIKGINKDALCSWVEGKDPKWSGYNENTGNPLENILKNDSIYPPTVFVRALEHLWMAWRDGTLDDQKAEKEVQELFDWVNETTRSRPKSEFWRSVF